jgi:hypothetical protein
MTMMSLKVILITVIVFSSGVASTSFCPVYSQEQTFTAFLSGDQEAPPNNSGGKGFAWFKTMGDEISYKIEASGIDKVTTIHIHGGRYADYGSEVVASLQIEKKTGPVNLEVGRGKITSYDLMGNLQGKSISDLVSEMLGEDVYVDIHTDAFPNGEIRGPISIMTGK